jgi:hypothetical protein
MTEDFVARQNKRLELLRSLEDQLKRLNELVEHGVVKDEDVAQERKELRLQMIRIIAWMGV